MRMSIGRCVALLIGICVLPPSVFGQAEMEKGLVQVSLTVAPIDGNETIWDGSVALSPGEVKEIKITGSSTRNEVKDNGWKTTTCLPNERGSALKKRAGFAAKVARPIPNTVLLTLARTQPSSKIEVTTANGNFDFLLKDIPYGEKKKFLKGKAVVERVPASALIVSAPTEDDFPAAVVAQDGSLYVAYMAFTHGEGFAGPHPITEYPKDFSPLGKPTGGDQLMFIQYKDGRWSKPEPLTKGGEDLYKTAIAVDRSGRVWVFWSQNVDGNWDLFTRSLKDGKWSEMLRLTTNPGADTYPVATTDSEGNVWVAWMGFRGDTSADIIAARQEGEGFTGEIVVTSAPGDQWEPAIAASPSGEVAFAWDTYEKGDFDVYCRLWQFGDFGEAIAVSASLRHEARPAIAFDKQGRLWIAYENGPERWGKDSGALEQFGSRLYTGRQVSVRVLADGALMDPAQDVMDAFVQKMEPESPKKRRTLADAEKGGSWFLLAAPILAADANGRVWLGARSKRGSRFGDVGTVWFEEMTCYEGERWIPYVSVPGTDNLLDNRPALAAMPGGNLIMVNSSDQRDLLATIPPPAILKAVKKSPKDAPPIPKAKWGELVNDEIFAHDFNLDLGAPPTPKLKAVPPDPVPDPEATTLSEIEDIARVRGYRTQIGGKEVRIFRGEFHRHTEISGDGGGDGTLQDMWRYALDAASMDWIGNGDHDNGGNREYSWWITQKTTDIFHVGDTFVPMFTYERSCGYPDGHRNVVFAKRGVRTLPRFKDGRGKSMDDQPETVVPPNSPDSLMLFDYLKFFNGVCASHTSATDMGTDWRDWGKQAEPLVEIYQGDRQNYEMPGAPRANTEDYSIGGWRPRGFVSNALKKGYRLGFQSSSDHGSVHMSYCNVFVEEPTREAILTGMQRRHVYGSTDNIIADVRCGERFMGDEFSMSEPPTIHAKLIGAQPFAKVHVIKDGEYVHTIEPKTAEVEFTWVEKAAKPGVTSYYYVRGEQEDGEMVWASPMWIKYEGK